MKPLVQVLVVDDSPSQLALIVGLLRASGEFNVVGTAGNGKEAVTTTERLRPAVVAMDIHLPLMDGYEATRQIMQRCPTPIVMFSNSAGDAEHRSIQALAAGALAVVRKPGNLMSQAGREERETFLKMLRLMAHVPVITRHAPPVRPFAPPVSNKTAGAARALQLLAVATSTGGPAALQTFFSGIGSGFPLPIAVVQHISRGFSVALVDWLASVSPQPMHVVVSEEHMRPGHAYFAPDDHHLVIRGRGLVAIQPVQPADRYSPSADVLFNSTARTYGAQAIGVIMTGMGDDGALGMQAMYRAGAITLAQDEASSVVYGMPQAAILMGAVSHVLSLTDLAPMVLSFTAGLSVGRQ